MNQGARIDWRTFKEGWVCVPGGTRAHHIGDGVIGIVARTACRGLLPLHRADDRGAIAWQAGTVRLCGKCRNALERRRKPSRVA